MPSKRANGEGSVFYDRSRGRWCAVLVVGRRQDGRLRRRTFTGGTRTEVVARLDAAKAGEDMDAPSHMSSVERRINRALSAAHTAALTDAIDVRGLYVYVLWGTDPAKGYRYMPLYVGKSTNVLARLGDHMGDPDRRRRVRRVTLTRCEDAEHMSATEVRLIRHYRPPWNVAGNGDD